MSVQNGILCELQEVGSSAIFRTVVELSGLVGSEQPHLSLMPLIITEVKHATKSLMGESECVASLKVRIQQHLPHRIMMTDAVRIATLL